jgi:NAD(P)-dependent dehydrogenase (short-subunit alcohol dehydrogenase family)
VRATEAFLPLIQSKGGRIVNVGSGAGPNWLNKADEEAKSFLVSVDEKEKLLAFIEERKPTLISGWNVYGFSKAVLTGYGQVLAKSYPDLVVSTLSPGFIDTNMTKGRGASKTPEEGTVSIRHCLFSEL